MAKVRFTRRCFEEDLQSLPRWAQAEALRLARETEKNPEIGTRLAPPLDAFRRLWIRSDYRMLYTYDFQSDTWWIVLIAERRPGRPGDVYELLKKLAEKETPLK